MSPDEVEKASTLDLHLQRSVEGGMGVSKADELKQLLYDRAVKSVCHFFE